MIVPIERKKVINNIIKHIDGKWYVKSETGKNLGGPYDTKEEAEKRLKQVEFFKHNSFQHIISNFKPIVRHDTMEGREYLVAPMVMMVEGVHQGSSGPLYYPALELSKTPEVWNHKPVVVYHPTENGQGISACSPEILTNRKIGLIMNASFEDGKLKAEAWLDVERTKKVDNRIWDAIEANQMMELSTGLFTDLQETEGEWNEEKYTAVAINYRPDHLAVLPDLVGACSVADGAGFLRVNSTANGKEAVSILIDISTMEDKQFLLNLSPKNLEGLARVIRNELSFDDTRQLIYSKLNETNQDVWVEAIFDTYFIYQKNGGFKKQEYKIDKKNKISFEGLPKDVQKVVTYNEDKSQNKSNVRKETIMDKKTKVDALIAHEGTQLKEEDRESLMAMEESILDKLTPVMSKKEPETAPAANTTFEKKESESATPSTPAANAKPITAKEYIEQAPLDIQRVLQNGIRVYEAEKKRLINIITSNERNPYTEEQLKGKDVDELRNIAILANSSSKKSEEDLFPIFNGQQDPITNKVMEPMGLPVVNFEKVDKK